MQRDKRWWLGLSGGVDSVLLLHALAPLAKEFNCELVALHIHHGLSAHADQWLMHCHNICAQLNVQFVAERVQLSNETRQGIERKARNARWQVFDAQLSKNDCLWLAHHQDDQVETLLLNLLRGTGVQGASAMQAEDHRRAYTVLRPFLGVSKNHIIEQATLRQLSWIHDESNDSLELRRNYLRHQVLPAIELQWPGYRQSLTRFCDHMQSTQELIDELAEQDLNQFDDHRRCLSLNTLLLFSGDRQKNILRYWLKPKVSYLPSQSQLDELMLQLRDSSSASKVELCWGEWVLKQSSEALYFIHRRELQQVDYELPWPNVSQSLTINAINQSLTAVPNAQVGVRLPFENEIVLVRSRQGGEQCWPANRDKATSLKKVFNEYKIPDWQRDKIPLIFYNDQLVAAVGLFYCKPFLSDGQSSHEFLIKNI